MTCILINLNCHSSNKLFQNDDQNAPEDDYEPSLIDVEALKDLVKGEDLRISPRQSRILSALIREDAEEAMLDEIDETLDALDQVEFEEKDKDRVLDYLAGLTRLLEISNASLEFKNMAIGHASKVLGVNLANDERFETDFLDEDRLEEDLHGEDLEPMTDQEKDQLMSAIKRMDTQLDEELDREVDAILDEVDGGEKLREYLEDKDLLFSQLVNDPVKYNGELRELLNIAASVTDPFQILPDEMLSLM